MCVIVNVWKDHAQPIAVQDEKLQLTHHSVTWQSAASWSLLHMRECWAVAGCVGCSCTHARGLLSVTDVHAPVTLRWDCCSAVMEALYVMLGITSRFLIRREEYKASKKKKSMIHFATTGKKRVRQRSNRRCQELTSNRVKLVTGDE